MDATTALTVYPLALAYCSVAAALCGWLRVRREMRTAYTRKIYHFLVISVAAPVHLWWGLPGVMVYGTAAATVVLVTVLRGAGAPFYEALARPTDEPHRTLFILVPLGTTALGGLVSNVFFPAWAFVGYMVVAWGDAVGEPVGSRWGRTRYRTPTLAGVPATRSVEGSAAVLLAGSLAAAAALLATGLDAGSAVGAGFVIGAVCAAVEAFSNHGLDNLTVQVAAAGVAWLLLG